MQTGVIRAALAALLFTGIIGSHVGYGLNSVQAAGKDNPVTQVKTDLCSQAGDGNFVMTYNTEGMVRGVTTNTMEPSVKVY